MVNCNKEKEEKVNFYMEKLRFLMQNMISKRPVTEVELYPYNTINGLKRYLRREVVADLNEIYSQSVENDRCFVSVLLKPQYETDIWLITDGVKNIYTDGVKIPCGETRYDGRLKTRIHLKSGGSKVIMECVKSGGKFFASYMASHLYFPFLWVSDYLLWVSSAGSDFAVIDGTRYNVTESCLKNQSAYIKPGVKGIFVRDVNGDICYIVTSDSGDYFAYVINCGYEDGKDELFLKLLLENGDIKSYYVRDKAKLDSVAYKSKEKLWDAMGGRSFRHRLIKCAVSDNEIIKLETAGSNVKNGGFEMYYTDYDYKDGMPMPNSDNHKRTFRSASMTIGGKVALSGNTIIMIAPNDPEEMSDKYYAVDNTYIKDDKDYRVEAYRDNDSGYTADVLVIYDDVSSNIELTDNDIGISVIGGIIDAADEDDEPTYMIEVYNGGVMEQYMLREKDMLSKVYGNYTPAKGDIIRYELKDEKINKMELIYSVQAGKIVAPPNRTNETNTNHYQQFRVWDAYVFYRWGSFMMLSETEPTDPKNYNYRDYDIHPCAASSIVICEQGKSMEVYGGTADDIIGYKNTNGAECSKVVVYERWGDGKSIVVYR